ncbi:hypothetical protein [Pararhodobacter oceanensis]|uniref:hypothetical protein n=1 Tax=Pararhodobacter oceanensis TaxID=2172121 RepID=UPI0010577416|nr:hypothetical protein [Pararhodobacter oceanensis]
MTLVCEFRPSERIIIDSDRLEELFSDLGDRSAEAKVMETVVIISDLLVQVDASVRAGDLAAIGPKAKKVSRLSAEIGMTSLARVSRDLAIATAREDAIAYRAVWQRLVRIGDRSLSLVWEQPGLSI